jgi:hypothetical protein
MHKDKVGRKDGQHCMKSVIHCLPYYKATNHTTAQLLDCLQYGRLGLFQSNNAMTSSHLAFNGGTNGIGLLTDLGT